MKCNSRHERNSWGFIANEQVTESVNGWKIQRRNLVRPQGPREFFFLSWLGRIVAELGLACQGQDLAEKRVRKSLSTVRSQEMLL